MADAEWRPGSFTKNFSWGSSENGLKQLHEIIRVGFEGTAEDVPRIIFRSRVAASGRPDYIPINFFLYNQIKDGTDFLLADELVFQAINFEHSDRFDHLALFAFNFSSVGQWKAARAYQSTPALWAKHYITDRVARTFEWNTSKVSADDIEQFVSTDRRYVAKGARKLATNLNYLYRVGGLSEMTSATVERWWVDSVFLALDRVVETRRAGQREVRDDRLGAYLTASGFDDLSRRSIEKDLARQHLTDLYSACGGRGRFSDDEVSARTAIKLPDLEKYLANDPTPIAAVHVSNPRILKSIPRACANLAHYLAGFEILDLDSLQDLDLSKFVRDNLRRALDELRARNISPQISAEELMKLMRDR